MSILGTASGALIRKHDSSVTGEYIVARLNASKGGISEVLSRIWRGMCVAAAILVASCSQRMEPKNVKTVTSSDIASGKVVVIGDLGVPLGKLIRVKGKWITGEGREKPSGPILQVLSVDGNTVDELIEFDSVSILGDKTATFVPVDSPNVGEVVEGMAFEKGAFRGFSAEVREAARLPIMGMVTGFVTTIAFVEYKVVSPGQKMPEAWHPPPLSDSQQ